MATLIVGSVVAVAIGVACGWYAGAPTWRLLVFVAGSMGVAGAAIVAAPDRRRYPTPPGIALPPPDMGLPCCPPSEHGRFLAPLDEDTAREAWQSRTDDG